MTKNGMREEMIDRIVTLEDIIFVEGDVDRRVAELRAMDDMELIDAFEVASFNTGTRAP